MHELLCESLLTSKDFFNRIVFPGAIRISVLTNDFLINLLELFF